MRLDRAVGIGDLQRLAKKRLPRMVYDYMEGGCDDEEAIAENGAAFRAYKRSPGLSWIALKRT